MRWRPAGKSKAKVIGVCNKNKILSCVAISIKQAKDLLPQEKIVISEYMINV
jgi:hypothetical protein